MSVRRATQLSIAWLVFGLAAGLPLLVFGDTDTAVSYWAVYVLERTLSLDNVFIFLLILGYFGLAGPQGRRVVWWAIAGALALRAVAIVLGIQLLERFSFVTYVLGALLVVFAVRMLQPEREEFDPQSSLAVRGVRRIVPAITPAGIALAAMIAADLTFAVDSIPAAFGITRDVLPIWLANATALLGLIPLMVLVRALVRRFRYMRQTLAAVLATVGARLLAADVVTVGPLETLAIIVAILVAGVAASVVADRHAPPAPAEEQERRPPRCPPEPTGGAPQRAGVP